MGFKAVVEGREFVILQGRTSITATPVSDPSIGVVRPVNDRDPDDPLLLLELLEEVRALMDNHVAPNAVIEPAPLTIASLRLLTAATRA